MFACKVTVGLQGHFDSRRVAGERSEGDTIARRMANGPCRPPQRAHMQVVVELIVGLHVARSYADGAMPTLLVVVASQGESVEGICFQSVGHLEHQLPVLF